MVVLSTDLNFILSEAFDTLINTCPLLSILTIPFCGLMKSSANIFCQPFQLLDTFTLDDKLSINLTNS